MNFPSLTATYNPDNSVFRRYFGITQQLIICNDICYMAVKLHRWKTNEMAFQWAEMRMIRWVHCVKVTGSRVDRQLQRDYIIKVLQWNRLRWYGHVSRKDENDWMTMHVWWSEECRPRDRLKKLNKGFRLSDPTTKQGGCYGPQHMQEIN